MRAILGSSPRAIAALGEELGAAPLPNVPRPPGVGPPKTVGSETVDGKDCYKVALVSKDGKPSARWYDKKTGLLLKMATKSKSPMGEMEAELYPQDYRKEGDVLMPHKVVTKVAGQEMTMSIDKVEQNVEIPKEKLEPPAEVKALIKK